MEKQNYQNHVRYYPAHHFVFYPIIIVGFICSVIFAFRYPEMGLEWGFAALLFAMLGYCAYMMRQHYGLMNQDRIVRLEVRLRYYTLTGQRFELLEPRLSLGQILALRFASDKELVKLVKRAMDERLTPDQIKRAVVDWQGDYMRV